MTSGAAYKITVRETEPIIWYRPVKESEKGESWGDRVSKVMPTSTQVNQILEIDMLYNTIHFHI